MLSYILYCAQSEMISNNENGYYNGLDFELDFGDLKTLEVGNKPVESKAPIKFATEGISPKPEMLSVNKKKIEIKFNNINITAKNKRDPNIVSMAKTRKRGKLGGRKSKNNQNTTNTSNSFQKPISIQNRLTNRTGMIRNSQNTFRNNERNNYNDLITNLKSILCSSIGTQLANIQSNTSCCTLDTKSGDGIQMKIDINVNLNILPQTNLTPVSESICTKPKKHPRIRPPEQI